MAVLEYGVQDPLPYYKRICIMAVYELLTGKPEQERTLLRVLVNKLGDPDRKLAAKVTFLLTKLVTQHPGMKRGVVEETERVLHRPGLAPRALYYSVIFLNQIALQQSDAPVAQKLVAVYLSLFTVISKKIKDAQMGVAGKAADKAARESAKNGKDAKKGKKGGKGGRGG